MNKNKIMKKSTAKPTKVTLLADAVKEAHHGLVVATVREEISRIAALCTQMHTAMETRDYRKLYELINQSQGHVNNMNEQVFQSMHALGYMPIAEDDDDDDY